MSFFWGQWSNNTKQRPFIESYWNISPFAYPLIAFFCANKKNTKCKASPIPHAIAPIFIDFKGSVFQPMKYAAYPIAIHNM